jgi:hypothetical protein
MSEKMVEQGSVAVRERPILFSGEMVRAILDGRKTQTRRVVKPQPVFYETLPPNLPLSAARHEQPGWWWHGKRGGFHSQPDEAAMRAMWARMLDYCPYGTPGDDYTEADRLWVRETWGLPPRYDAALHGDLTKKPRIGPVVFGADYTASNGGQRSAYGDGFRWRPSIHMPRWASRITLEITEVRVERVQDVSEEDAEAEGYPPLGPHGLTESGRRLLPPRAWFTRLWTEINGPRGYGWDANPWVWAITFRRLSPDPQ